MCHCADCQRRTGSAFSVAVFFPRDAIRLEGEAPGSFERPSASGYPVAFFFCRRCGSNVYWQPARMPDLVGVALGAFANLDIPPPVQSVWTKDMHGWLVLPDSIQRFDEAPPASR
jgi:hypothetical protein